MHGENKIYTLPLSSPNLIFGILWAAVAEPFYMVMICKYLLKSEKGPFERIKSDQFCKACDAITPLRAEF